MNNHGVSSNLYLLHQSSGMSVLRMYGWPLYDLLNSENFGAVGVP